MNTALAIIYAILLLFALTYAGINVYHIIKYRPQLPLKDAKGATAVMWLYITASGVIVALSVMIALFYIYAF